MLGERMIEWNEFFIFIKLCFKVLYFVIKIVIYR